MYAGCDLFLHTWDERYHALVAKHLVEHPLLPTLYDHPLLPYDYRDWRHNHIWLHKPPLALWLMAAAMRLLGTDEIAMRLPSLLLSTLAIFLTYVIGAALRGTRTGLLAAAFQAVNGYLLQLPGGRVAVDHVDTALLFCVELGICCAVLQARGRRGAAEDPPGGRSWWGWTAAVGAACGLAVLAKWLPGLLPAAVWLALVWRRERPRRVALGLALLAACCAAVALPWQLYCRAAFPLESSWEAAYNSQHLLVPIEGLGGPPWYHLLRMPRFFGELIWVPVAWFLLSLVPRWRALWGDDQPPRPAARAALAVWLLLPYAAFSIAATKLGGYVMIAAPALFIIQASSWVWLCDRRPQAAGRTDAAGEPVPGRQAPPIPAPVRPAAGRWAAAGGRWLLLVLLPLLPLRYTVERLKIRATYDRNPPWARALRALPARLGPGPVVLFHLDRPIEAMFYTPYPAAYAELPTPAQARRLLDAGYRVVVLDAASAPAQLRRIPGIELRAEAIPAGPANDGTGERAPRPDGSDSPLAGTVDGASRQE